MSIITSIGVDHTEWLGKTEHQIAAQKAGIIKQGGCVISGVRGPGRTAIAEKAKKTEAKVIQIDTNFKADMLTTSWRRGVQTLSFLYTGEQPQTIPFGLLGVHQVGNAASSWPP